jgi:uncharacterized protein (DUF1499 family)
MTGLLAAGVAAALAWPRVNDVETGRTAGYPDLQPRRYPAGSRAVMAAVKDAVAKLPGWTFVGAGSGPGGTAVQVARTLPLLPLTYDVTVRIQGEQGGARVSVRSRSRLGPWDFGQNARNIRELLAALDRELAGGGVN